MYEAFYNFRERPFNLTPDPKYLFLSERHREALAHLLYGIRQRCGFILLTGEVGTGKTTLCRSLLRSLDADTEIALILNPNLSAVELLQAVNREFGLAGASESRKALVDELNAHLLARCAAGKNLVLLVDEAQNLPPSVLEELRLLSNLETEKEKLLQIILIGQPELNDLLRRPELRQLDQRMSVRYHLSPLDSRETSEYIHHRLGVASEKPGVRFTGPALRRIYRFSRGAPRLINIAADRALLIGFTRSKRRIRAGIIGAAVGEVRGTAAWWRRLRTGMLAGAAATAILAAGVLLWPPARRVMDRALMALPVRLVSADALSGASKAALRGAGPTQAEPRKIRVVTPTSVSLVPENQLPEAAVSVSPDEVLYRLSGEDHGRAWAAAVNALLRRWNGRMITGADIAYDVSLAAEESGLRSTRWTGSLTDLTRLNLPALVEVELPGAGARYLALTGYGDNGFTTNLDERTAIPISALEPIYTGTAYVFWKDQQAFTGELAEGDHGPGVLWVKNVLARLGLYQGPLSDEYDEKLRVAVATLQAAHGLEPDGIVGEQTKMLLHSRTENDDSPRLTAVRPESR